MVHFVDRFPDSDLLILHSQKPGLPLPVGEYGFFEWYCNEDGCDCRRVLFQVQPPQFPGRILATINYGWETANYYSEWMHGDPQAGREITGGCLDPLNEQSELADALLDGLRELLKADPRINKQLMRHYQLFKSESDEERPKRK
jgi:hypothetical protein